MIKVNQPLDVILTLTLDPEGSVGSLSGSTATFEIQSPAEEVTVISSGVTIDPVALEVTGEIPANTLNRSGEWKIVAVVTTPLSDTFVSQAAVFRVESRFECEVQAARC